jgi:mono/diheme cytochrome c family protein
MRPVRAAAVLLLAAAGEASAQGIRPEQRPAGVTDSAIAWGRELFHGSANCAVCHGEAGRGTGRGPNITGAIPRNRRRLDAVRRRDRDRMPSRIVIIQGHPDAPPRS